MARKLKDLGVWLSAAVAAILLLVGVPLFLWTAGNGWPGPTAMPSGGEVREFFTTKIADESVFAIFILIGWLAWAHFVWVFSREFFTAVQQRERKELHTVALSQRVARLVVSGLFRLGATSTAVLGVAGPAAGTAAVVMLAPQAGAQELPDDVTVEDDGSIQFGTDESGSTIIETVGSPREGKVAYLVHDGDTLWDIADNHLGDATRWREVFDNSKGYAQPGSHDNTITNPRLIWPGSVLLLPSDATNVPDVDEGLIAAVYGSLDGAETLSDIDTDTETDDALAAGDIDLTGDLADVGPSWSEQVGSVDVEPDAEPDAVAEPVAAPQSGIESVDVGVAVTEAEPAEVDDVVDTPLSVGLNATTAAVAFGATGAMLATYKLAMTERGRRRRMRDRTEGETPAPMDEDVVELDQEMRHDANEDLVDFYGHAWRSLANRHIADTSNAAQPVLALRDGPELQVLMSLPDQDAPAPWTWATSQDDESIWSILVDHETQEQLRSDDYGSLPLMLAIGEDLFTNLEATGPIGLSGDPARMAGLARALMLEAASAPWADAVDVRVTTAAAEALHLENEGVPVDDIMREANSAAERMLGTLDSHNVSNIYAARASMEADAHPTLIVCDATDRDAMETVVENMRLRRVSGGLVVLNDHSEAYNGTVDEAGTLTFGPSGLRCRAAFASVDLGDMFDRLERQRSAVVHPDLEPVAVALSNAGVAQASAGVAQETVVEPRAPEQIVPAYLSKSIEAQPAVIDLRDDHAAVVPADDQQDAPIEPNDEPTDADGDEPDNEPDLVEWMVQVLGSPKLTGEGVPKLSPTDLSIVTLLALEGDKNADAIRAAIYGVGADVKITTWRSVLSRLRGKISKERFPEVSDGRYQLVGVTTDFGMFMERFTQAYKETDQLKRLELMMSGTALIKGQPFGNSACVGPMGWADSSDSHPRCHISARVGDAVLDAVHLAMELERVNDALQIVELGRLANPYSIELVCWHVRILFLSDQRSLAERIVAEFERRCVEEFDDEPPEQPRAVLDEMKMAS